MSKAHLCYPYSIHSIRVAYILDNGKFIEDTAYFNVKSNIDQKGCIEIKLFKGLDIDLKCRCEYSNDHIKFSYIYFCKSGLGGKSEIIWNEYKESLALKKIPFYPEEKKHKYETYICSHDDYYHCCKKSCFCVEVISHPYYRESDFIPREPYKDPNAPLAAGVFGAFFGTAAAFILGPAAIPVIGLAGWTAATGLSGTAILVGVLGGGGAISSYFATLNNDGKICINLPTINVGNSQERPVNEIGVPIYLRESDYQQFDTKMTKSDLINKINNHPITAMIAQYPRLFKKT
jgi:hypothetical protein